MSLTCVVRLALLGLNMLVILAPGAMATTQVVSISPQAITTTPDQPVELVVRYRTENPPAAELSGLGLRIHWNSSRLELAEVTPRMDYRLTGVDRSPQVDRNDADGVPETDRYVTIAWADIQGIWPGSTEAELAALRFQTTEGWDQTQVSVSASSVPPGADFRAEAATVIGRASRDAPASEAPATGDVGTDPSPQRGSEPQVDSDGPSGSVAPERPTATTSPSASAVPRPSSSGSSAVVPNREVDRDPVNPIDSDRDVRAAEPRERILSVSAEAEASVQSGDSTELTARITPSSALRDRVSIQWTQIAGPSVALDQADTLSPHFTAPAVEQPTRLRFELAVLALPNRVWSDTVSVRVEGVELARADRSAATPGSDAPSEAGESGLINTPEGDAHAGQTSEQLPYLAVGAGVLVALIGLIWIVGTRTQSASSGYR